jgi:hypothetical protein
VKRALEVNKDFHCVLLISWRATSFLWSHQIRQGFFTNEAASIPGVKVVTTTAHGLPHETTTRGKQPDALITVPQPPGLYGPLLSGSRSDA